MAIVTGGAGLLGRRHCEALARAGAVPVIVDIDEASGHAVAEDLSLRFVVDAAAFPTDITDEAALGRLRDDLETRYGRIDILVNNAANDPKVDTPSDLGWARLERFPLEQWEADLRVGLTGAFLCSKILGAEMARRGSGVIVNIASDLAVIAPDQRLYLVAGAAADEQPVKPVSYSVVKTALLGLTRYLATYWADAGVRVNAISPGGVRAEQPAEFVERLSALIPLGRMAEPDEYGGLLVFLCSEASSYITGQNLVADGGRSVW